MPTQTLTDARCRAAKPGAKLIKLFDGGGMHLAVLPSGVKVWRIAYRLNGKPKTISLGPYPDVSLAQARSKLTDVKTVLRDGGDPMAQRSVRRSRSPFRLLTADARRGSRAEVPSTAAAHQHPADRVGRQS